MRETKKARLVWEREFQWTDEIFWQLLVDFRLYQFCKAAEHPQSPQATEKAIQKPLKMHVGTQRPSTNPGMLQFFKRHGVDHCCGWPPPEEGRPRRDWKFEEVAQQKDLCEKHGLSMDIIGVPFMTPLHIDQNPQAGILLGENPERDREIEYVQNLIVACAKAGVPCFKYNLRILGTMRTGRTSGGRGGSTYSTWKFSEAKQDPPLTRAGPVSAEVFWERIEYFLERVIPVCEEYKIRAACHPHDPGVPPEGFSGSRPSVGNSRRPEEVRLATGESLPRSEPLPRDYGRDAPRPRPRNSRHHPLFRRA